MKNGNPAPFTLLKPPSHVSIEVEVIGKCDAAFANWFVQNLQAMIASMPQALREEMDLQDIKLIALRKL